MHKRIRCTGTDSLSSSCVLFWLCTQLLVVASALIVTPILIGVTQRYLLSSPLVLIGHICDALMAVDVAIAKATCLRKKRRKILAVSPSWLLLIMSSALVVVPVVYSLGGAEDTLAWCTIFRMLAVLKLPPLYRLFKQAMEKKGLFVHETYVRVVLVFVFAIFYSSILACAWFYLSCRRRDLSTCLLDDGLWVARDSVLDIRDPVSRYFRSLYFVVQTLFTIGYGDIYPVSNSEIMFTLFLILNGSLFYAFMISSITSLLSNRDATTKLFRSETNVIKDFFSARGVASDIAEQMQGYFDFLFSRKKGVLEGTVLAALPSSLSLAVKASFAPCLEQVAFFQAIRKHCACFAGAGAERASRCTCCGGIDIVRACAEQLTFR